MIDKNIILFILMIVSGIIFPGCNTVDDDRIPAMPVNINLASTPLWVTYGVSGYGEYKTFIKALGQPRDFPFTDKTLTGCGGVLLVSGVNPFTMEAGVPVAYDLSCPVECKSDIRVRMQNDGLIPMAVCPKCGSVYDVVERGGSPVDGPALSRKYGLQRYECRPGVYGGYLITNI